MWASDATTICRAGQKTMRAMGCYPARVGGWRVRAGSGVAAFVAVAFVAALPAGAAEAVTPPTGDQQAIAYFSQAAKIYSRFPGVKVTETGYYSGIPSGPGSVRFVWARPVAPGYTPQTATIVEQLDAGKIAAFYATLTGPKLARVRVLMAGGSVFLSSSSCWTRATPGSSPLGTGNRYLFNDGGAHFLPLQYSSSSTSTTFTYTWPPNARATETDTFGPGTRPPVHVAIEVTGGQRMHIVSDIKPLSGPPKLPIPSPPARPVPKPICQ